tara:strand:- start:998 stop:2905 length:1908 start_codon:yes stop_codon:yes gene_type:complete
MKFIYKDLLKFLTDRPSKEALSKKLFQLGHEHEIDGDLFDMEITPNRGDCLSLFGLSRDLNIFYNFKDIYEIYSEDIDELNLNFKNLSIESCPKISFLELEIDKEISSYKPYLEGYFLELGNNKTNFFTDISNYISYERGQPTHCFDRESLGDELTFSDRPCNESFKTLLGNNIELKGQNSVFTSNEEIISLAGVMGGESTACSNKTKKVLVECAYFNPEAIIGKTIKYNLKSDAAHKFERGVDSSLQEKVLRRFISIVKDHASIKSLSMKTFVGKDPKERFLPIDTERINSILGTKLTNKEYLSYLSKLGFEIADTIKIPFHRHDIASQNDLSEEVARIIGYENIKTIPFRLNTFSEQQKNKIYQIKDFFVQNGFSEVINFPFTENAKKESIKIDNPLDSRRKNLRISLKDSLIENLLYNERRQKDSVKLFEISDIYSKDDDILQEKKLGIIVSGKCGHNYIDFSKNLDANYLSEILKFNNEISIFDIEEISRENIRTKKKERIFYVEILLDDIPETLFKTPKTSKTQTNFVKYHPISEYPSSSRDFSLSIKNPEQYDTVISYIENFDDQNLKDFFIFDFYKNEKNGEIKVGIRLIFQSILHTLSETEIKNSTQKLLRPLINLQGVSVPGLDNL